MIYKAFALIYLRKCDIIYSLINKNLTEEVCVSVKNNYCYIMLAYLESKT